jgi:hypothetical protein
LGEDGKMEKAETLPPLKYGPLSETHVPSWASIKDLTMPHVIARGKTNNNVTLRSLENELI